MARKPNGKDGTDPEIIVVDNGTRLSQGGRGKGNGIHVRHPGVGANGKLNIDGYVPHQYFDGDQTYSVNLDGFPFWRIHFGQSCSLVWDGKLKLNLPYGAHGDNDNDWKTSQDGDLTSVDVAAFKDLNNIIRISYPIRTKFTITLKPKMQKKKRA